MYTVRKEMRGLTPQFVRVVQITGHLRIMSAFVVLGSELEFPHVFIQAVLIIEAFIDVTKNFIGIEMIFHQHLDLTSLPAMHVR